MPQSSKSDISRDSSCNAEPAILYSSVFCVTQIKLAVERSDADSLGFTDRASARPSRIHVKTAQKRKSSVEGISTTDVRDFHDGLLFNPVTSDRFMI